MFSLSAHWLKTIHSAHPSPLQQLERALLNAAAIPYGIITDLRNAAYDRKIFTVHSVPVPVVSIGNLSVGGTGKTALTLWCAEFFKSQNKKPAILSRGYRRKTTAAQIVSNRKTLLLNAADSGDEPYLMAKKLKTVPIIVDSDRTSGARLAIQQFSPDVLILDDGFQHRKLARTLDIVSLDDRILTAPKIFPRGLLRENVSSLNRAGFIVIKTNLPPAEYLHRFQSVFKTKIQKPIAFFNYEPESLLENKTGTELSIETLRGKKVIACSAIANPEHFETLLGKHSAQIVERLRYPDHHAFTKNELTHIQSQSEKQNAIIITTEKDIVRMPKNFPAQALKVTITWQTGETIFKDALLNVL